MPSRCCVPSCNSNFDSWLKDNNPVAAFKFPKNEKLRKLWVHAIPRKNWAPTNCSYVCVLHFNEEDVRVGGSLKRTILAKDAVPRFFKNVPSHLNKPKHKPQRQLPEKRHERVLLAQENKKRALLEDDRIVDFKNFVSKYQENAANNVGWSYFETEDNVSIFIVKFKKELCSAVRIFKYNRI